MNKININYNSKPGAVLPEYKTEGAAGADLCAYLPDGPISLLSGTFALVPTGLFFEIPFGYEVQIRPRSGLDAKNGITVLNTPGTIDSDYRGEIKVILMNLSKNTFTIQNGDRIAQMVVAPVTTADFTFAEKLSDTTRGSGGMGSTGVNS